ncbi:hypothetical protein DPMN_074826 [Dreissena polymorpha]|uniref:Uncharacterized protein n=1 Tax=Dreissena polymorpha TaxID=45954 RepID=A0A9D3YJC8_DREPO|nr:hypothetical protein DPMN_074826 [Dreissena polymorpha]
MPWYDMNKKESIEQNESDFAKKTDLFPAVREAMIILSTLKRGKTWLRSTMSDDRLSG